MTDIGYEQLRAAAQAGETLDGLGATVDSGLIRKLCREAVDSIDPRGLLIEHAAVMGPLDLSAFNLSFPLAFHDCTFDSAPNFEGANLHSIDFVDCTLPGLLANGVNVRRDVNLSGATIFGRHRTTASIGRQSAVWLCESIVGGRLLCIGTTIDGLGDRAIQIDRMKLGGAARFMNGFVARGEVRMLGIAVDGSVEFAQVTLENPSGFALHLGDADIRGALFLLGTETQPSAIRGRVDLSSSRISGQLTMRHVSFEAPAGPAWMFKPAEVGTAVHASQLTVGADVIVGDGSVFNGELAMAGADIGGLVFAAESRLVAPANRALDLTNAEIRSRLQFASGIEVRGRIRLPRAHVHGRLLMAQVHLRDPEEGVSLDAYGLVVDGNIEMPGLLADGGKLVLVNVACRQVDLSGARLASTDSATLDLRNSVVQGDVDLDNGFFSEGVVALDGAQVEGQLGCHTATFTTPSGANQSKSNALTATAATFRGGMDLRWTSCDPGVHLGGVTTSALLHDPEAWPVNTLLSGLTYDRLGGSRDQPNPWNARRISDWLDGAVFDAGSYENAARVFQRHGYGAEAEYILIRGRDQAARVALHQATGRLRTRLRGRVRFGLNWLFGRAVGYGYRPGQSVIALLALLVLVVGLLQFHAVTETFRAADPSGNVYAVDGRLATATGPTAATPTTAAPTAAAPSGPARAGSRSSSMIEVRDDACGDGQVRCFNRLFYAVDTVVPLVSLNQRSTWYPNSQAPWGTLVEYLLNIATLLGWLLSTIVVLSFARLARTS